MAMQYDVLSLHINVSSQALVDRTRVKGLVVTGGSSGTGYTYLWDATSAPVAGTYNRSAGGLVTVTQTAHGLSTGQRVGLVFAAGTGGQVNPGNYVITKTGADTYTFQDINTGAITGGAATLQGTSWLTSIDIAANESIALPLPGEGLLAVNGLYVTVSNLTGVTLYHG